MFKALLLDKSEHGEVSLAITEIDDDRLPDGDVTVAVTHSTLNYKDGLAITNRSPIVRNWPMVPGIDFAGAVEATGHDGFDVGDRVVLNGWEVGEKHWGGLAQKARVAGDWLVTIPEAFTNEQAMAIGTAGYTAMLCVLALEEHGVTPDKGPVAVTGAAGGVGSVAIAVLAKLGYEVVAVTGRVDSQGDYLRSLGASDLLDRNDLTDDAPPLAKVRWAGAIDAVGGTILANLLAQTDSWGCVAACGLAQSMKLPTTVAPFILRGVTLAGVNSVFEPAARRQQAWDRLAADLDPVKLDAMTTVVGLDDVPQLAEELLAGTVKGRVVVDVNV